MVPSLKQPNLMLLAIVVLTCLVSATAQDRTHVRPQNSLSEVRDMQRVLLVVFKSRVIDVSDAERAIIEDVLKADPVPRGRNRWAYHELARKLNKYIKKYKSLTPASELADADYVIYFNVVEFRRILDAVYPYGELFVIVKGSPEELKPPRVVWRANKVSFAGDAIRDLIRELKLIRGEG